MIAIGTGFDQLDFIVYAFQVTCANRIVSMVENTILKETQFIDKGPHRGVV